MEYGLVLLRMQLNLNIRTESSETMEGKEATLGEQYTQHLIQRSAHFHWLPAYDTFTSVVFLMLWKDSPE